MYQMKLQLSTLSRNNLKRLLRMVQNEMDTMEHPCGGCDNSECATCPYDEYCSYLSTMYSKIKKELHSRAT